MVHTCNGILLGCQKIKSYDSQWIDLEDIVLSEISQTEQIYSLSSQLDCQLYSNTHSPFLHSKINLCEHILPIQNSYVPVFLEGRYGHSEFELR